LVVVVLGLGASTSGVAVRERPLAGWVLGRSADGRAIRVVRIGQAKAEDRVLVVGCIHGNECAGISIARWLERVTPPPDAQLSMIEDLNPEGFAAGTRQNGRGVDLNRNFPWHWGPLEHPGGLHYSGTGPLSEPEST
jgi:protein MpaA